MSENGMPNDGSVNTGSAGDVTQQGAGIAPAPKVEQVTMPNIIDLKNAKVGDTIQGVVLMETYAVVPYGSAGKKKIDGTVSANGIARKFIVWSGLAFDRLCDGAAVGRVVEITATVGEYRGEPQITVSSVTLQFVDMDPMLLQRSLDTKKIRADLSLFMQENLSEDCLIIFNTVLKQEQIGRSFIQSPAAVKMHDAVVGGLMNHSFKMLKIAKVLLENDPRLLPEKDLIYLSILFHDLGKTREISNGAYTEFSFVTHRIIVVDMLAKVKDEIIDKRGEGFYWHLVAIMIGHHGDFEDPCRTVWAKIVHLIDMLESQTTMILDRREDDSVVRGAEGAYIWDNGKKLVY